MGRRSLRLLGQSRGHPRRVEGSEFGSSRAWVFVGAFGGGLLFCGAGDEAKAGSGFFLRSQSTTTLGSAQAGSTASTQDISQMGFNPAILTAFSGHQIVGGATVIATRAKFDPAGSNTVLGTPILGNDGGDSGTLAPIPYLYGMWDVSPDLKLGLAGSSYFGLSSNWGDGWVGRYYALKSELVSFNLNPVVAYRIHPMVSIGLGLQAQYADVNANSAIDFGTIDQTLLGGAGGGIPGGSDGEIRVEADDWAYGVSAGVLLDLGQGTRIGAGYRSGLSHDLRGDATFSLGGAVGSTVSALTGAFVDTGVESELDLPDTLTLGFHQDIGKKWSVMGDVMWMNWSRQDETRLTFENPAQPDQVTEQDWNNSWFATLGAVYRLDDRWTLRAGAAYDQTPIPERTRTPVIADQDSYWVGLGAGYSPLPNLTIDFAYGHIFTEEAGIDLAASDPGSTFRGNLSGTVVDNSVDYLSIQAVYRF